MAKLSTALGGNAGAILAGGGMCVALALGAYIGFGGVTPTPATQAAQQPATPQIPLPQPTEPQTAEAPTSAETEAGTQTATAPTFDELRRETDGTTIIAGRAEPLSDVAILLDGEQVATAKADGTGGFAAIAVLPPKDTAQVVSLSVGDGEAQTASRDEIILAPAQPAPAVPATEVPTQGAEPEETQTAQAPAQAPVAVLKSDADGVELLQAARPSAMTAIALDTIGYSDVGDVQLTGRAQPETAKVRVYLNNRSVISLDVNEDGRWRGDLPDVDEGIYTLRVDEVNAAGAVSSRVETPFKRESAEVLAQAATQDGPVKSITVQTGATLWAIARERYGDGTLFVRVVEANADTIRNPDLIYPGQIFDLPN